ncbi:outer membrane usher protein [Utexia brackfieldae]|uniref:outer membrane usher protein n=1 Tax=Utexia brackfieldae TaxID=3074108 RepID=UPI00370D3C0A
MSFCLSRTHIWSFIAFMVSITCARATYANDYVQFNTDVLDLEDRKNIDLNQFALPGYIMPGTYTLKVRMNNEAVSEQPIEYYALTEGNSQACLSKSLIAQLGLKPEIRNKLTWLHDEQCLDLNSLPGMEAKGDLATATLNIQIPQAYLEYRSNTWDPPSLWDDGVNGLLFDYNVTTQMNSSYKNDHKYYNINGNGVMGANLGAWRVRADWQGRSNHSWGETNEKTQNVFDWTRIYAYTAIPQLNAKLSIGENYLSSALFDSFRYTGISLNSDLNMLPPNLRGYAPEVTGIANSNATVIITQAGRVIYQTQVPSGPFQIQDLPSGITGQLDIRVEEQDGSVQNYQVNTASIPYLTRPGSVRYNVALGRPTNLDRHTQGNFFVTGDFSWGISNGWSLFGGSLNSENYDALSLGLGRDLFKFGAISLDMTQSFTRFPEEKMMTGGSFRVNYSKRFDSYNSQIQFAGYRFTQRNYMSMSEYLTALETGDRRKSSREMYTLSFNKNFTDIQASLYFNYDHQTYWNSSNVDRYSLMASKYFDIGALKNISVSLSAYRQVFDNKNNDGLFLSLTLPLGDANYLGYSLTQNRHETINQANYYSTLSDKTNYQVAVGNAKQGTTASAYINHQANNARLTANVNYMNNEYYSFGVSAKGGITLTSEGVDTHRVSRLGGTRLLVDTDGVANIPVKGSSSAVTSNRFGKAVIPDVNSYYRNKVKVDLNKLPEDAEVTDSVVQFTLTDGAIGYRKFSVLSGQKMMVNLTLESGELPPFGAQIINNRQQETGIVDDNGMAYISGIQPHEVMFIKWNGAQQCRIVFPAQLTDLSKRLSLVCQALNN